MVKSLLKTDAFVQSLFWKYIGLFSFFKYFSELLITMYMVGLMWTYLPNAKNLLVELTVLITNMSHNLLLLWIGVSFF